MKQVGAFGENKSTVEDATMDISFRADDETSGFFRKTTEYALYVKLQLTPQERDAINDAGIEKQILYSWEYRGAQIDFTVGSVRYRSDKGGETRFVAPSAALRDKLHKFLLGKLESLEEELK